MAAKKKAKAVKKTAKEKLPETVKGFHSIHYKDGDVSHVCTFETLEHAQALINNLNNNDVSFTHVSPAE